MGQREHAQDGEMRTFEEIVKGSVSADLLRRPTLAVACTPALARCMQLLRAAHSQSRVLAGHRSNQPRGRKLSRRTRLVDATANAGHVLGGWASARSSRCRQMLDDSFVIYSGYEQYRTCLSFQR